MPKLTTSPTPVSQRIRELISLLGGPKKASQRTGISQSQLSQWQSRPGIPWPKNLERLARASGVTVDWILTGKIEGSKEPIVAERPDEYLTVRDRQMFEELKDIYREGNEKTRRRIKGYIDLEKHAAKTPKQRASGDD